MILLTLQNISKSFAMNEVLRDVNLTLQSGARMGLVGVNGSGKSTLFRIISGQMEPDSGTVSLVKGTRVGMLTQDADIQSDLTIQQELERVFEPVREMESRMRQMEAEMAEVHDDPAAFRQLSDAYARLVDRFESAGGYEWPSRIQGVLAGLGFARGRAGDAACEPALRRREDAPLPGATAAYPAGAADAGRAHQPSGSRQHAMARGNAQEVPRHGAGHQP